LHRHERRGSAIGTFATLWALCNLGISGTMWIAAGIAGVGVLVSYFTAPETRGRSLHEAVWL
jgi:MFS transporter, putative metabolite transport protein